MRNAMRLGLILLGLWGLPAHLAAAAEVPESQQLGKELLLAMANHLASLDRFTVTVRGGYDARQGDGRKVEFLETRDIALARPDRLRSDEKSASGRAGFVLFDGSRVTVFDGADGVYAQADQPGSIDDAVLYFIRDLGMRLPLAPLLTTRFPQELATRLQFADYVEESFFFDVPTHHVVGGTGLVDFQVWIEAGDRPVPRRIVMTYRGEVGEPQYWADFTDWNLKPRFRKSHFEFDAPKDARQIAFAVQLALTEPLPTDAAVPAGETP